MVSSFKEQALLSNMTKEAIKVGLAVSLSIILAFSFGWEKAYWSVMTVFSLAATESYSRAIVKAEYRIIGTLIGIFLAVVLVALFSQDRVGFITFLSILLVICTFMNSHKRLGYIFMMTFILCVIITCSGQFNDELTFSLLLFRIQENVLGIVVYSLVFSLIWPKKVADSFFEEFAKVEENGHQHLAQIQFQSPPLDDENGEQGKKNLQKNNEQQLVKLYKLKELLTLPLADSPRLDYEKKYWHAVVNAYLKFEQLLSLKYKGEKIDPLLLQEGAALLRVDFAYDKQKIANLSAWSYKAEKQYLYKLPPVSAFNLPLLRRCKDSLKALSIFLTTLALWMYIPIPGAYMMPLIGAVCAIAITPLPSKLIRYTGTSAIATAIIILAQLVFIMPLFTEAWQIAGLYFFNVFMIYKISEIPGLELQKLIGGNLAVAYGMGALQATPSYDVIAPLLMVIFMLITLGIVSFYCKLFHSP